MTGTESPKRILLGGGVGADGVLGELAKHVGDVVDGSDHETYSTLEDGVLAG